VKDKYTFGIEEEYFLVDAGTKFVTRAMPEAFLAAAKAATNGQVRGEFLQSQLEVATLPHHGISYGAPSIDIDKLRAFKEGVVKKLTGGLAGMAKARKVEVITGVNLPMLIKLASTTEPEDLLQVARDMREHGRNAIWVASDLLRGEKT